MADVGDPRGRAARRAGARAGRDVLDALRAQRGHVLLGPPGRHRSPSRLKCRRAYGTWWLAGIVTSDGFGAVRSLFSRREAWARRHLPERRRLGLRPNPGQPEGSAPTRRGPLGTPGHGRHPRATPLATDELAEQVAGQLLARWGVVFWDLLAHEDLAVPWREILWALRRFEARGLVRGGRFVTGFAGEQYALPEALEELRHVRRSRTQGQSSCACRAADPLNLSGVVLPGRRVPALRTNSVVFRGRPDRAGGAKCRGRGRCQMTVSSSIAR